MNIALDGESPYDNGDLFHYLQKHMSILKSTTVVQWSSRILRPDGTYIWGTALNSIGCNNAAFYTTDGMRFEFHYCNMGDYVEKRYVYDPLHESGIYPNIVTAEIPGQGKRPGCGSYGLMRNPNNTVHTPCKILVDVNGDRKPYPANIEFANYWNNILKIPSPNGKKVSDVFTILITEDRAVPFGVLAQRAMYQAQK